MASAVGKGNLLYQDEMCMVFDVEDESVRQSSIHFQVVPKNGLKLVSEANAEDEKIIGHLLLVAGTVAYQKGMYSGYHVMLDEDHRRARLTSLHVFQRALHHMLWPVGPGSRL